MIKNPPVGGFQVVKEVDTLAERAKKVKIKAREKPVIEAYLSTLIERAFRSNTDIRFF